MENKKKTRSRECVSISITRLFGFRIIKFFEEQNWVVSKILCYKDSINLIHSLITAS